MDKVKHPTDNLLSKHAESGEASDENESTLLIEIEEIPTSGLALMQACGDSESEGYN